MTSSSVMRSAFLVLALIAAVGYGQQAGTETVEAHPSLPIQTCTAQGACTTNSATSITLDSNWRWTHDVGGYANCYTGNTWSATYCPTPTACAANCALEGLTLADYESTYGITTASTELTIGFVTTSTLTNVGSRVYLMENDDTYMIFNLKNQEFAFDVDASNLPCGLNGALYFAEMSADGGMSEYSGNAAGAKFGTGYCDSQCPQDIKFINGEANIIGWTPSTNDPNSGTGQYGTCCNELDIWEANSISTAFTPHPCSVVGQTRCLGTDCGEGDYRYDGVCDKDGCDFNSYRMGNQTFYGPGMTINSNSPITVVTQFLTSDGTATGDLVEIKRFYKQNGVVVPNSDATFSSLDKANSLTDDTCIAQKTLFGDTNKFTSLGGLKAMGDSMARGMVLVMSLWDDHVADCLWLDSTYPTTANPTTPGAARGTCATTSGVPATVEADSPGATVKYSNIKIGAIGSTTAGVPASTSTAVNAPTTAPIATGATSPTNAPGGAGGSTGASSPTNAPGSSGGSDSPTDAPGATGSATGDSLVSAAGLAQVSAVVALVAVVMMM